MVATMMTIRRMAPHDLPFVVPLLHQLGYEVSFDDLRDRFAAVMSSPDHAAFVCERDGRPVGFAHFYGRTALEKPTEAVVQAIVVDEACRKAGIGNALIGAAERWAVERGYGSVCLYTRADRDDAHAFYAQLGYRPEASAQFLRKTLG